ncbi:MAG: M81 family metallopeptidase [Bacteroidales bacterium]
MRILTCGIRHESNTFSTFQTTEEDFTVEEGEEILQEKQWARYLQNQNVEIIPTLHAYAWPSGVVKKETFERFKNKILSKARETENIDGVFLDMHGALHVEGYDDAQVHFIKELREVLGEKPLFSGSFDLHGNVSSEFVEHLDLLTAYRTAPHRDGPETDVRAVRLLVNALRENHNPQIVQIKVPILIPGEKGITESEPLKSLYENLPEISQKEGLLDASIFVGYAWADLPRSAMRVDVVAKNKNHVDRARQEAKRMAQRLWDVRKDLDFDVPVASIDKAIEQALEAPEETVYITDSGDNTTAGAAGDNPLVLERLLANEIKDAVVGGIVDSEAVKKCETAGTGSEVELTLGGKMDTIFGEPLNIQGTVQHVTTGEKDSRERPAVIEVEGIHVVLLNVRRSFTSPEDFREVGIDPLGHKIVVVKLGYLYPKLRDIAPKTIMALTPGFCYQVVKELPYKRVQRPIYPLDPEMSWNPQD